MEINRQIVVSTGYNSTHTTQHSTTLYGQNSTPHNSTRPQLDTSQLYTGHMAVGCKLLYSSEPYEQSVNVITIRQ